MIRRMTTGRPQKRYDHRLRELVRRTGDLTIATDLGVPRSTARGWLRTPPTVVVSLDVADMTERELRQEVQSAIGQRDIRGGREGVNEADRLLLRGHSDGRYGQSNSEN